VKLSIDQNTAFNVGWAVAIYLKKMLRFRIVVKILYQWLLWTYTGYIIIFEETKQNEISIFNSIMSDRYQQDCTAATKSKAFEVEKNLLVILWNYTFKYDTNWVQSHPWLICSAEACPDCNYMLVRNQSLSKLAESIEYADSPTCWNIKLHCIVVVKCTQTLIIC